jgi:uncharacterized membrane protein
MLLLIVVVLFLLVVATEVAFQRLGFDRLQIILILIGTFLGSSVNVPVRRFKRFERRLEAQEVRLFWITYRIPRVLVKDVSTLIAINLGGAIIPTVVSIYLLIGHPQVFLYTLLGVSWTAIIVHLAAQIVPGFGIATPAFIPPLTAALIAYVLQPSAFSILAYVSGTLGTLIGADLTNLRGVGELGAPVVSIGGAGTFDGVFLSGLIAVLLV